MVAPRHDPIRRSALAGQALFPLLSVLSVALCGCHKASPGAGPAGPVTVDVTTLRYGEDSAHTLDLHVPSVPADAPMATVVLAHGGLWQGGDKGALSVLCDNIVIASGGTQACATINYRLSQELGGSCTSAGTDTYRAQVTDLASAFVHLQNEADRYGLNPAAMYVGGHSAGGHLSQVLNLRWAELSQSCSNGSGCPAAAGAIGFEGIYDIPAWDAYDASYWGGSFACATRRAFGAPPGDDAACMDAERHLSCWEMGSPTYLAQHSEELGLTPVGHALLIHSPGDDWVDINEATRFGDALLSAHPSVHVITNTDGSCASGQHNQPLSQPALAGCIARFIASSGSRI